MELTTYDFSNFPYFDGLITIPSKSIFYRGISKGKKIKPLDVLRKDKPIYLSSEEIANAYCRGEDDIFVKIVNNKELKLIDIRKVMLLLPNILNTLSINENNTEIINILKVTLGITTLDEQIELCRDQKDLDKMIEFNKKYRYFKNGMRMAATNVDSVMVVVMRDIFSIYCDGIIAPRLDTLFGDSNFSHEEIILFNTENLFVFEDDDFKNIIIKKENIKILIDKLAFMQNKKLYKFYNYEAIMGGRCIKFIDKNYLFDDLNFNKMEKKVKRFVKDLKLSYKKKSDNKLFKTLLTEDLTEDKSNDKIYPHKNFIIHPGDPLYNYEFKGFKL